MIARAMRVSVVAVSAAASAIFLFLAWRHLHYPAEMDYIEGVMMDHVVRLAHSRPIYVAPSLDFVALAYMPLFTTVVSLLARVFGPELWEPRFISLLGTLGIVTLAVIIVRRESRSWTLAIAAGGLYLMGYGAAGGGHYDASRPDSMMLFLSLAGLATLRFTTGVRGAMWAALLLTLAFFTKQHAAWFGIAALLHLRWNDRDRFVPFALALVAGCVGGYFLLALVLGPWFMFYTWDVPSHWSHFSKLRIEHYLGGGLLGMLGPLTVPTLLTLALPEPPWRGRSGIWMWAGLGAFGTGMLATFDPSAWRHVFMPSMVVLSILGPISLGRLIDQLAPPESEWRKRAEGLVCLVLVLQIVPLIYAIHSELPHPHAAAARADFIERLRAMPGRVIVVEHGFYATLAGKDPSLQVIAIGDLERALGNQMLRKDPLVYEKMFLPLRRGPGRPALITDEPLEEVGPLWASIAPGYRLADSLGAMTDPLRAFHGHIGAPQYVYLPREDDSGVATSSGPPSTGRVH
jgi:4-amino-4-deoxy-L-arabinose transferase-like glycosyltransferase